VSIVVTVVGDVASVAVTVGAVESIVDVASGVDSVVVVGSGRQRGTLRWPRGVWLEKEDLKRVGER
jgi:hypothetical protein